jgi:hypothetical protein
MARASTEQQLQKARTSRQLAVDPVEEVADARRVVGACGAAGGASRSMAGDPRIGRVLRVAQAAGRGEGVAEGSTDSKKNACSSCAPNALTRTAKW